VVELKLVGGWVLFNDGIYSKVESVQKWNLFRECGFYSWAEFTASG